MGLKDLEILPAYETLGDVDPVDGFYIPALAEGVSYDRSVGFFSSASLALAARGIAGLINNGGKMRLVVSHHLSEKDIDAIRSSDGDGDAVVEEIMARALGDVDALADEIERDHVRALGWMLSQGYLELRIACVVGNDGEIKADRLFHQKVGIIEDADGSALSFSGSINETVSGWLQNSEEFKVFRSWADGERSFFDSDVSKFQEIWNNEREHVRTFKPKGALCDVLVAQGKDFDIEYSSLARAGKGKKPDERIPLFFYQKEAFEKWKACGGRMLFEMATGTGKTRTALACVQELLLAKKKLLCVIATPQSTLSRQWERELENLGLKFDCKVFADSSEGETSAQWASKIRAALSRIALGRSKSLVVFTTHKSAANPLLTEAIGGASAKLTTCLVGDEVHGMGARGYKRALLDRYEYRIGLSATPSRWFDEEGTECLRCYFGDDSYQFTIADAQETVNPLTGQPFLCPYEYHIVQVCLDDEEADEYEQLTKRISKLSHSDDADTREHVEQLLRRRANIKKNAIDKMARFDALLPTLDTGNMLIFTSPERIEEVEEILAKHLVSAQRFTKDQGTRRKKSLNGLSERDHIIRAFKCGTIQALVAIKCLDEGIDIPQAQTAVLISSSTNPREYIQRVGRVIRQSPGKRMAKIYDFVVVPDWTRLELFGDIELERKLFDLEMVRIEDMRNNAVNSTSLLMEVMDLQRRAYGN